MERMTRLRMQKPLKISQEHNKKEYPCSLVSYDEKEETLCLRLLEGELSEISLDALYECEITEQEGILLAIGRVQERYRSRLGAMLKIYIENGFYKNNIKLVDKIQG